MPSPDQGSITHFFDQLRQGDAQAAERLWGHFAPRILTIARKTLSQCSQRVTDSDDAAQSAFLSFWQRATRGDFSGDLHRENLWRLLATITVRKALKHQQRQRAAKRGGGRIVRESSIPAADGKPFQLDQAFAKLPARDFDMICEELLLELDDDLRAIALLKLMNHKNQEIAELQNCSLSTVERKLGLIRRRWREHAE